MNFSDERRARLVPVPITFLFSREARTETTSEKDFEGLATALLVILGDDSNSLVGLSTALPGVLEQDCGSEITVGATRGDLLACFLELTGVFRVVDISALFAPSLLETVVFVALSSATSVLRDSMSVLIEHSELSRETLSLSTSNRRVDIFLSKDVTSI